MAKSNMSQCRPHTVMCSGSRSVLTIFNIVAAQSITMAGVVQNYC